MTVTALEKGGERLCRLACIGVLTVFFCAACNGVNRSGPAQHLAGRGAANPLNAVYRVEGRVIPLREGHFEMPAAPGSAAKVTVAVLDTPVTGDLDGDGDVDAAMILVNQTGGSGTFYYLAAAINLEDGTAGTNAVMLGDRIVPRAVRIQNRVVIVEFADRRANEPMAVTPTVDVTRYAILDGDSLLLKPAGSPEAGWVIVGHEVRSFWSCQRGVELWISGRSPALADIATTYRSTMTDAQLYAPLFMVLTGSFEKAPGDGFGADYAGGFFATGLTAAGPSSDCRGYPGPANLSVHRLEPKLLNR